MKYKHLFGPIHSRRLGISLGVDLIPFKTCNFDCLYCECGKTSCLTMHQKEWVPIHSVIDEIDVFLKNRPFLDYITFSGSGEPTLHSGIKNIVDHIKRFHPDYKICLLTNSTLLNDSFFMAAEGIDLVVPSMDAATEKTFQVINRPHHELNCQEILNNLFNLRKRYKGNIHLELMFLSEINDKEEELKAMKRAIAKINPDRCLLGTLDRQGTESWIKAVSPEKLKNIAGYLGKAELIGAVTLKEKQTSFDQGHLEGILALIRARPCSNECLLKNLDIHPAELPKYINYLINSAIIEYETIKGKSSYRLR